MKRATIFSAIFNPKRWAKLSIAQKTVSVLAWTLVGTVFTAMTIVVFVRGIEITLSENHIYTGMTGTQFAATVAASALLSLLFTVMLAVDISNNK